MTTSNYQRVNEKGSAVVEYVLMVGFLSVLLITVVHHASSAVSAKFTKAAEAMDATPPASSGLFGEGEGG
ncbi:MAG TPA: Flp family type IVb pilin [Oligoflexia bacterium]|nr:Flp family type IVb pilin [Oligoflexia bacterium]HMP49809.1 Flp family type IVb pilin [Oligoflexia bacterium]